jgi:hypothetical protein
MGRTTGVLDEQAGLRTRIIYWLVKQAGTDTSGHAGARVRSEAVGIGGAHGRPHGVGRLGAAEAKGTGAAEGGGHGRVPALNRHSFCRGQKGRDHRGAVVGPGGIRAQHAFQRAGKASAAADGGADTHAGGSAGQTVRCAAGRIFGAGASGTDECHRMGELPRAVQSHVCDRVGEFFERAILPASGTVMCRLAAGEGRGDVTAEGINEWG